MEVGMLSFQIDKETGELKKFDSHEQVEFAQAVPLPEEGKKFDNGKLDWTLMPFSALEDAIKVLMFGASKYSRENWKLVADGERRYKAAGLRHMIASAGGEEFDPETGIRHTAHAMVNLLFAEWLRQQREGK
jgi:hypothetical protein